jgi:hypothetical protein
MRSMEFKMRRRFDHLCLPMYRLNWVPTPLVPSTGYLSTDFTWEKRIKRFDIGKSCQRRIRGPAPTNQPLMAHACQCQTSWCPPDASRRARSHARSTAAGRGQVWKCVRLFTMLNQYLYKLIKLGYYYKHQTNSPLVAVELSKLAISTIQRRS